MFSKMRAVTSMIRDFARNGSSTETVADTGYHGFINRVSRLPRLFLLFGVIGLFVWPMFEPEQFKAWTDAITTIPENLWILILMIVGSWATTKFIRDVRSRSAQIDSSDAYTMAQADPKPTIRDEDLLDEADQSNSAIQDWKRNATT